MVRLTIFYDDQFAQVRRNIKNERSVKTVKKSSSIRTKDESMLMMTLENVIKNVQK